MEDMGTVLMHVDAIDFFRVDVACNVIAAVDDKQVLPILAAS